MEMTDMTTRRFSKHLGPVVVATAMVAATVALAQDAETKPEPATLMKTGDVLSGELNALRMRSGANGKRVATYQLTSTPRRLMPPNGLCGLETGPETFQIVTNNAAQVAQLRGYVGKEVSVKVEEVACAQEAGQISEAVVSKWSVVVMRH
jgi:hypothetical protein